MHFLDSKTLKNSVNINNLWLYMNLITFIILILYFNINIFKVEEIIIIIINVCML